jgi:hypothetical protein
VVRARRTGIAAPSVGRDRTEIEITVFTYVKPGAGAMSVGKVAELRGLIAERGIDQVSFNNRDRHATEPIATIGRVSVGQVEEI